MSSYCSQIRGVTDRALRLASLRKRLRIGPSDPRPPAFPPRPARGTSLLSPEITRDPRQSLHFGTMAPTPLPARSRPPAGGAGAGNRPSGGPRFAGLGPLPAGLRVRFPPPPL